MQQDPVDDATSSPDNAQTGSPTRAPMYGNKRKALDLLERCQRNARSNTARQPRDRADLYNLKLHKGGEANHWIVWDNSAGTYIERPSSGEGGLPPWFHRATTNHFANKIDGIAAILNQSQPAKNWYATREDEQSRAAAEVCEMADPVLLDEIDYPHNFRPRLNKLITLTNLAALVITYDNDPKWGEEQLPVLQCAQCQQYVHPMDAPNETDACPECQGQLDWATHPQTQMPIGVPYPKGRLSAELASSFEVSLPKSAGTAHEDFLPWVTTHQRWATEDAISRWPTLKPLLDATQGIRSGSGRSTHQAYADQMRDLSAPVTATGDHVGGASTPSGPVIWRLWHDPIDDDTFCFPDGLFLTVLEGQDDERGVLDVGPLPFKDEEGRPFKNVLLRQFVTGAGSQFGKPPGDDLAPLQVQLNLALSLAFLILMHHGSPRTFIPSTVSLHDQLTGMPGKNVGFNAIRPGDKPHVEPGLGFPTSLQWFIEFIIQSFDTISKTNAVLLGQRPDGNPTLGEVEILQERGFAAFQEPLEALVAFERRLSLKLLAITRASGWATRYADVVGEGGEWKLKAFTGADLDGHIAVDIDLATAWPKSPMLTNLRLAKAFELGILNPQDPEVAEAYLRLNDLLDFKRSTNADQDQVDRQLDAWKQAQTPQQIAPPETWWRLDYHLFRKTQFLKSELFEQLRSERPEIAQAMLAHVQQLQLMLQPPPTADPHAEAPAGAGGALEHAVRSGVLTPAGGPGAKQTLHHAVAAGAVRPAGTGAAQQAHQRRKAGPGVHDLITMGAVKPKVSGAPMGRSPNQPTAAPTGAGAAS